MESITVGGSIPSSDAPSPDRPTTLDPEPLTYEEVSQDTGIPLTVWKRNVNLDLWELEPPDVLSEETTPELLTTYLARCFSEYCMLKMKGTSLKKSFKAEFDGWTEHQFGQVNRTFQKELVNYLEEHGVDTPTDGSFKAKLASLVLPTAPTHQQDRPAEPTSENRKEDIPHSSREQTIGQPPYERETTGLRTEQLSAIPRGTPGSTSNPGVPGTRTSQDITLFPSPTPVPPDQTVRLSGPAYVTEYDIPPSRVICNGKIDQSKIVTFSKVWRKERNYTGKPYDIFADKVRIFIGTCRRLDIPEDQYYAIFPDILSGRAEEFFLNHIGPEKRWDEIYYLLDSHFNTSVNHGQYFTDWTGTSFARLKIENAEKKPTEVLEMLLDKLQLAQRALGTGFQGEVALHTSVVRACRGVPELEPALIYQKPTCEALFSDLRASLNTAMDRKISEQYQTEEFRPGITPNAYIIDRRFTNNRTKGNRPTYNSKPPYSNSRPYGRERSQRPAGTFRPKLPYGNRQFQRGTCRVCHKQGCWSTNHPAEERTRTMTQYLQACDNTGQDLPTQEEYDNFVRDWEGNREELEDDEEEYDYLDPEDARLGITYLTDAAFYHRLTGEDIYSLKPAVQADQFNLSSPYSQTYQGELWDTGAALLSTVGKPQAEAYVRENPNVRIDWTPGSAEIKFGSSKPISSIGTIDVRNPLGVTRYHILDTMTPFLLSLYDADRLKAYYNNVLNLIVREDGETLPVVRKWGHPFFNVSRTESILHLTEGQLRHLHRRFGHPRTEKLHNLLKNAGHDDVDPTILDEIQKFCSQCQSHDPAPRRFKFSLQDEYDFNYEVIVDIVHLNGRNALHVIDSSTSFQAATFLSSLSARDTWNALCKCWIYVYQGPPDYISHDPGTHFQGEFRDHARVIGITCKQMPIEAHWAVGKIERAHAPLRRAFDILWKDLGNRTDAETVLQMAVKALNDTAGPDGLVPTLLVFGAYPRIDGNSPPSPDIQARGEAVRKAMKMLRKTRANVDIHRALNTRNGPAVHDILTLPLRSEVLVWREKEGWTGPYKIAAIEDRTIRVDTPDGPKAFRVTQIKPYYREEAGEMHDQPELQANPEQPADLPDTEPIVEEITVAPARRGRGRPRKYPLRNARAAVFLTQKEQENYDLAVKLRQDGVVNSSGYPFQESDAEEIDNLAARGVFEFVRFDPAKHTGQRIFKTRLVREIKGKTTKPYEKSRLVVQGYGDTEKEAILTQSPTIQRMSQRLLLALGPTLIRDFNVQGELRDITQAYTQSHDKLNRPIYARLPAELKTQYPEGTLLWIVLPLYGLAESGLHWFKTYHSHHVRNLGMTVSTYNTCLLFTTEGPDTFGITAIQTDDTFSFATAAFSQKEEEKLAEEQFRAKPKSILTETTPIEFNGGKIRLDSHDILFEQKGQVNQLKPVDPKAIDRDQQYVSQRARGAYLASICQPEAAYDLSTAAQVQTPGDKDIDSLNERINWQIQNPTRGLRYIPLDLHRTKIYIFTDGSFANNKDLTSQLGYLIVLGQEMNRTKDQFQIQGNIIHWSSTKCKRVTRSVLASELYGTTSGVDSGIALSTTLRRILRTLGFQDTPITLCTDSRSLYDCLVKLGTTNEKRLMIDIMSLRESYERREISEICCIDSKDNPADALTKASPNKALEQMVSTNSLTVRMEAYVERLDSHGE